MLSMGGWGRPVIWVLGWGILEIGRGGRRGKHKVSSEKNVIVVDEK